MPSRQRQWGQHCSSSHNGNKNQSTMRACRTADHWARTNDSCHGQQGSCSAVLPLQRSAVLPLQCSSTEAASKQDSTAPMPWDWNCCRMALLQQPGNLAMVVDLIVPSVAQP